MCNVVVDFLLAAKHPTSLAAAADFPTLHVIGDADPYKAEGEATLALFGGASERSAVFKHDGGHVVPQSKAFVDAVMALVGVHHRGGL